MSGETGKDVVNLCIQNLQKSGIFPDDHSLMRRIAHVMSNDGNPPFPLHTDGGIWQVSLFALSDTHDTRAHIRLGRKYGKIMKHFGIDWKKVERIDLAIPMYSAIAARLYLSNFPEFIPPEYSVEEQADYWWYIYMKDHESKRFMARNEFIDTVKVLNNVQHSIVPSHEPKNSFECKKCFFQFLSCTNCFCVIYRFTTLRGIKFSSDAPRKVRHNTSI